MSPPDLIRDVLERVMEADPGFTEAMAASVEREIRAKWGGDAVYVSKEGRRRDDLRARVIRDVIANVPTPEIEQRHGVSRATIYRLLKRRP